jgi:hypothetical protein
MENTSNPNNEIPEETHFQDNENKSLTPVKFEDHTKELEKTTPSNDDIQKLQILEKSQHITHEGKMMLITIREAELKVKALEARQEQEIMKAEADFKNQEVWRKLEIEAKMLEIYRQKQLHRFNMIQKYASIAVGVGLICSGPFIAMINLPAGSLMISTGIGALTLRSFSTRALLKGKENGKD